MATYTYRTDGESGTVEAETLQEALEKVDSATGVTDTLDDGSWCWVEDADGNRLAIGPKE